MGAFPVPRVASASGMLGPRLPRAGRLRLIEDGDTIRIDADAGTIDLMVEPDVLAARKENWRPRETDFASGTLWKYAQGVGPAHRGAVTHPGGAKEKKQYADI